MGERPLIFSAPMVLAILAGRKTQTRRIVKGNPANAFPMKGRDDRPDGTFFVSRTDSDRVGNSGQRCPVGAPGDRLWVKETWRVGAWRGDGRIAIDYRASPEITKTPWVIPPEEQFARLVDQSLADCQKSELTEIREGGWAWPHGESPCRWRSPLFMPRWASRITLEITDVRVQRLQEISEEDAKAEGVEVEPIDPFEWDHRPFECVHRRQFQALWDRLNLKRSPWASNCWVWAISFRRVEVNP